MNREVEERLWAEAVSLGAIAGTIVRESPKWKRWLQVRGELCILYQSVVHSIANQMVSKLPKLATTLREELVSMGQIGLLHAIDAFDPDKGVRFTSYCGMRVRGAMLDELRRLDHLPRRAREQFKKEGKEPPAMLTQSEVPEQSTNENESSRMDPERFQRLAPKMLRYFCTALRPIARMVLVDQMSVEAIAAKRRSSVKWATAQVGEVYKRIEEVSRRPDIVIAKRGVAVDVKGDA